MYDKEALQESIRKKGYAILPNVLEGAIIQRLVKAVNEAIEKEAKFHGTTDYRDYGIVQMCPYFDDVFLEVLEQDSVVEPFNVVLDPGCIIYVYISSSIPPQGDNFATRIHVDVPRKNFPLMEALSCLIPITPFTEENGGTIFLEGSHREWEQPSEERFFKESKHFHCEPGDMFLFNPRIWHSSGKNTTDQWRHCIAFQMVRPYMKQKFDLPKALADRDLSQFSDRVKQKLGFFSQPPGSYEEFYHQDKRSYLQTSEWEKQYNYDEY